MCVDWSYTLRFPSEGADLCVPTVPFTRHSGDRVAANSAMEIPPWIIKCVWLDQMFFGRVALYCDFRLPILYLYSTVACTMSLVSLSLIQCASGSSLTSCRTWENYAFSCLFYQFPDPDQITEWLLGCSSPAGNVRPQSYQYSME